MEAAQPTLKESDILIGVMGMTGVGKTSFVRQVTDLDMKVGNGLDSCTKEVQLSTIKIGEFVVRFIDTPGFDGTDTKDSGILKTIWEYISVGGLRLAGILYFQRITDDRVGGTPLKNLRMFQKLVGDSNMKNVILVTAMWGKLQQSDIGEGRVKELTETGKFWGGMIGCGATHEKYNGTKEDAPRIVQTVLNKTPCKLQIQEEYDNGMKLADTATGHCLETLKARHAQKLAELQESVELLARTHENLKLELEGILQM